MRHFASFALALFLAALLLLAWVGGEVRQAQAHLTSTLKALHMNDTNQVEVRLPEYETAYVDGEGQTHIVRTYPDEGETPAARALLHKTKIDALKEVFPPPS